MTSSIIYHNYTVLSPNGIEMFRCDKKKFDWYLRKSLASQIDNNVIRLLFEPKGLGWAGEHFYLQDRENKCCICGTSKDLSRHHVVPYCYRKYMPDEIKNNNYYDVLPLCVTCHRIYEKFAITKREELAKRYNAPVEGIEDNYADQINSLARTYIKHYSKIPEQRKQQMLKEISKSMNKESISEEELLRLNEDLFKKNTNYKSHGEIIVSQLSSFREFAEEWRSHFVGTMNPKHLPKNWNISRDPHGRL